MSEILPSKSLTWPHVSHRKRKQQRVVWLVCDSPDPKLRTEVVPVGPSSESHGRPPVQIGDLDTGTRHMAHGHTGTLALVSTLNTTSTGHTATDHYSQK